MAKIQLAPYQKEGLRRTLEEPFFPLFMEQGTGKTPIAIKSMEERYKRGEVSRVLIFAKNTLLYNWELELQKFLEIPKSQYSIERLKAKNKKERTQLYNEFISQDLELMTLKQLHAKGYKGKKKDILKNNKPKLLILLVNYEKALTKVMYSELRRYKPHMLIVDESHKLKNRNAQTAKNIYRLTRTADFRIIMTGTPTDGGYEDLFMQYKIMDEEVFGTSYRDFEDRYIKKGGYMGYNIVGYRNVDELKEIIAETSYRVTLEDNVKLPPLSFKYLTCELPSKARKAYNEMNTDMMTQLDRMSSEITRSELKRICREQGIYYKANESYASLLLKASSQVNTSSCDLTITKMMRLQQITGGFLTMDDGEVIYLGSSKLEVAKEEVLEASEPTIIFCQYVAEIELLEEELSKLKRGKRKLRVENFRDLKKRDKVYKDFQEGKVDVLILQLSSGSEGLNLQRATKLIFYSWGFSLIDYIQAIARIKRRGQTKPMQVIHIVAEDTRDMEILNTLQQKDKRAQAILE